MHPLNVSPSSYALSLGVVLRADRLLRIEAPRRIFGDT